MAFPRYNHTGFSKLRYKYVLEKVLFYAVESEGDFLYFYKDGTSILTNKGNALLSYLHSEYASPVDDCNATFWDVREWVCEHKIHNTNLEFHQDIFQDLLKQARATF